MLTCPRCPNSLEGPGPTYKATHLGVLSGAAGCDCVPLDHDCLRHRHWCDGHAAALREVDVHTLVSTRRQVNIRLCNHPRYNTAHHSVACTQYGKKVRAEADDSVS